MSENPMLPDELLLDFDTDELADWDFERAAGLFADHGDIYRSQLLAARVVHRWAEATDQLAPRTAWGTPDQRWAFSYALYEVAAFLRQGYFAPGGLFYDEELGEPSHRRRGLREIFPGLDFPDL